MNRWLTAFFICLGLLVAIAVGSCSSDDPSSDALYSAEDATEITAEELFAAYESDEDAADALYKGKLLAVSGEIGYLGSDPLFDDAPEVILSGAPRNEVRGVDCVFVPRYEAQVAAMNKGETVTVLGICDGSYEINVLLRECEPLGE